MKGIHLLPNLKKLRVRCTDSDHIEEILKVLDHCKIESLSLFMDKPISFTNTEMEKLTNKILNFKDLISFTFTIRIQLESSLENIILNFLKKLKVRIQLEFKQKMKNLLNLVNENTFIHEVTLFNNDNSMENLMEEKSYPY